MPIKGAGFLLTRKGQLAMDILKVVNDYLDMPYSEPDLKRDIVEVLDWIAGEVVKDAGEA